MAYSRERNKRFPIIKQFKDVEKKIGGDWCTIFELHSGIVATKYTMLNPYNIIFNCRF